MLLELNCGRGYRPGLTGGGLRFAHLVARSRRSSVCKGVRIEQRWLCSPFGFICLWYWVGRWAEQDGLRERTESQNGREI